MAGKERKDEREREREGGHFLLKILPATRIFIFLCWLRRQKTFLAKKSYYYYPCNGFEIIKNCLAYYSCLRNYCQVRHLFRGGYFHSSKVRVGNSIFRSFDLSIVKRDRFDLFQYLFELSITKNDRFDQKNTYFSHVFTVSPFLCQKIDSLASIFEKDRPWSNWSFDLKNRSIRSKNRWYCRFLTLSNVHFYYRCLAPT